MTSLDTLLTLFFCAAEAVRAFIVYVSLLRAARCIRFTAQRYVYATLPRYAAAAIAYATPALAVAATCRRLLPPRLPPLRAA